MTTPPQSLLSALKDFFVGVAIGLYEEHDKGGNRSMMIHPAVPKIEHLMFARWARQSKDQWAAILADSTHPDHMSLLSQFKASFTSLNTTHPIDYGFEELEPVLFDAIAETAIAELNTREKTRIPSIDWKGDYSWILVGGIGLDRGFTVEGLTVSYMPRSTGVGNADNIQQRARFFGYKKPYLGLCRIYLTAENIDAFQDYVSHEESVRKSIKDHLENGGTLKDWRRTWFLTQRLNPTRRSVVLLDMYQSRGRAGWLVPSYPYNETELVADNREVIDHLLSSFPFVEYTEDGWNSQQTVPAFSDQIRLRDIIPHIGQIRYKWPDDSLQHSSIMLALEKLAGEDPEMHCSVYMFSGPWSGVAGKRGLDDKSPPKIKNLFQGANARTSYPGARRIISSQSITFQIHRYDLEIAERNRQLRDVPVLAVHIPEHLSERVWVER